MSGQARTETLTQQVGSISARNTLFQKRFRDLLLTVSSRDVPAGWELARKLGPPAAPVLWGMLAAEQSNVDRRMVLLIAAVLAGGSSEEARLLAFLDQRQPMLKERIIAAMWMALGPRRPREVQNFWSRCIGPDTEPEPLLGLAVRLACARFPGSAKGAPSMHGDDPGMVAAAAFAGLRVPVSRQKTLWRSEERHAELFFRGALLGEGWRLALNGEAPTALPQAKELLLTRDERLAASRAAAILLCARAGVLDPAMNRPDWHLLQLVASQPSSRRALQAWLPPAPLARDEEPARLAVAFALYQPIERVLMALRDWNTVPDVRRDMAVALALRLAIGGSSGSERTDAGAATAPSAGDRQNAINMKLLAVPEFAFVQWAGGGQADWSVRCQDPQLAQLAILAEDGRASHEVARTALEESLWRWGSHPGMGPWRQERQLIRDLLLVGSKLGGGKYQSHIRPEHSYVATGLDRGDPFFTIAVELYEFLSQPVAPIPAEYRLE